MATGDFSHDKDMMERYCPQAVELCDFTTDINYDQGIWMNISHLCTNWLAAWIRRNAMYSGQCPDGRRSCNGCIRKTQ